MVMSINEINFLTVKEVAKWLGVTEATVRNWLDDELFPAYQMNPRGRIFIKESDVMEAIKNGQLRPKKYGR